MKRRLHATTWQQRALAASALFLAGGLAYPNANPAGEHANQPADELRFVAQAHAYSIPDLFSLEAESAGGGNRWFTGSVQDGFTCDVCHVPTGRVELDVKGLGERIVPGKTYELEVTWDGAAKGFALVGEIVNPRGDAAGTLSVGADRASRQDGVVPRLFEVPSAREVFAVESDLERTEKSFKIQWTAPEVGQGPLWLHVTAVGADGSEDPTGDEVGVLRRELPFGERSERATSVQAAMQEPMQAEVIHATK